MLRRKYAIILSALLTLTFSASVFAYVYYYSWESGVSVTVVEPKLGVYFDEECTKPVEKIDFGEVQVGARSKGVVLYIKNEGEETLRLTWHSTIGSESNYKMVDEWTIPDILQGVEGAYIDPGTIFKSWYWFGVASDCPIREYSWNLYLGVRD